MPFSGRIRSLIQGLRNAGKIEQRYAEDLESLMNLSSRAAVLRADVCVGNAKRSDAFCSSHLR